MESINETVNSTLSQEYSLDENDFLALSNIVIYHAILVHKKELKSNRVPSTFIKFFIHELSGYDHLFDAKLRLFFDRMNSVKTRISVLMKTFQVSFPLFVVKFSSDDFVDYLEVNNETIPDDILYYSGDKRFLKSSIDALRDISKHFNEADELRSIEFIFKDYLFSTYKADLPIEEDESLIQEKNPQEHQNDEIDEIIKNKQFADTAAMKKYVEQTNDERRTQAALLTGRMIELPQQKGKVISIIFPELPLPCDYPTLKEKSRVNTARKVKKFMAAGDELNLVNNFRFAQIKYSLDFINKRKVIAYDLKRASRFDFKF